MPIISNLFPNVIETNFHPPTIGQQNRQVEKKNTSLSKMSLSLTSESFVEEKKEVFLSF